MERLRVKIPFVLLNKKNLRIKKSATLTIALYYNGENNLDGMVVILILLDHIILILGYTDIVEKMFLLKLMNTIKFIEILKCLMHTEECVDSQVVN